MFEKLLPADNQAYNGMKKTACAWDLLKRKAVF